MVSRDMIAFAPPGAATPSPSPSSDRSKSSNVGHSQLACSPDTPIDLVRPGLRTVADGVVTDPLTILFGTGRGDGRAEGAVSPSIEKIVVMTLRIAVTGAPSASWRGW